MPSFVDLTSRVYGSLTVLSRAENNGPHVQWYCECACGGRRVARARYLVRGKVKSCGCLPDQRGRNFQHGMTGSPEHRTWKSIKTRCTNPNQVSYIDYGGRGITMCPEWAASFEQFYADMGPRPTGMTIDRINVDGNYEPANCRWATASEQGKNKRPYAKVRKCRCNCERGTGTCGDKRAKPRAT